MNDNNLYFPIGIHPRAGETMPVAQGVYWIRMPLPIPGLDTINLWLLRDKNAWTIVDTGLNIESIQSLWQQVFANTLGAQHVLRIICTHFHPDHMGLAGWLLEQEQCRQAKLWCTFGEWSLGRMLWLERQYGDPKSTDWFYRRLGWTSERIARHIHRHFTWLPRMVSPIPLAFRRLRDQEEFTIGNHCWRVITGHGHSPEHASLYCEALGLLISGDMVLPRISPHIGVYPGEPDGDPLDDYLSSLKKLDGLPETTLVLPSHGDPFIGLQQRLNALQAHHAERLQRLINASSTTQSIPAMQLIPKMFSRELRESDMSLATSEGLAHLNRLVHCEALCRETNAAGIYSYRRKKN